MSGCGYFDVIGMAEDEDGELVNAAQADKAIGYLDPEWMKEKMRELLEAEILRVSEGATIVKIDMQDGGVWCGQEASGLFPRAGYWISPTEINELVDRIDYGKEDA